MGGVGIDGGSGVHGDSLGTCGQSVRLYHSRFDVPACLIPCYVHMGRKKENFAACKRLGVRVGGR